MLEKTLAIVSCCLLIHSGVMSTPVARGRRSVNEPIGIDLLEKPCPASETQLVSSSDLPFVPPNTKLRLQALKGKVNDVETALSSRINAPLILASLQTISREAMRVKTRTMGHDDMANARNATKRTDILLDIKYWLLAYTVYSEFIQSDDQYLVDNLYLSQSAALTVEMGEIIQKLSTVICEIHLTIGANGFQEDTARYEDIRTISYLDDLGSADMYMRNYVIAYDFITTLDYAVAFFEDWVQDAE